MIKSLMSKFTSRLILAIIKSYQTFISPVLPARCRYYPTCSQYGITAVTWHGPVKGSWLTFKRICSCHPLGGHGIDFVPLPLYKVTFKPLSNQLIFNYPKVSINCHSDYATSVEYQCIHKSKVSRETVLIERGVYKDISSYSALLKTCLISS